MCVVLIMIVNLRGVRESGAVFAVPTYFFVVTMVLMVGIALLRYAQGSLGVVTDPPHLEIAGALQPLTLFLLLHAFSNGTTALTGIEAISNGITAFKEPRSHNAGVTLLWMAAILTSLFLGITFLATHIGAVPSEQETVVSQLARTSSGAAGSCTASRSPPLPSSLSWRRTRPTPTSPGSQRCKPVTASCLGSSRTAVAGSSSPEASPCSPCWPRRSSSCSRRA